VLQKHPISVAVNAIPWQFYIKGVFPNALCGKALDHGVTLVGLETTSKQQVWVIKNSWGRGWGEKGYIRLAEGNTCGVCRQSSYPTK